MLLGEKTKVNKEAVKWQGRTVEEEKFGGNSDVWWQMCGNGACKSEHKRVKTPALDTIIKLLFWP